MLSIPVIAMASISLYAGLYHLLIYVRSRHFRAHLTFSLLCFAVVVYDAFSVGLYSATSTMDGAYWQKLQFIALALLVPAFLWFVADYTNQKPGRAIYIYSAFYVIVFFVQVIDRSNLTFLVDQPSIKDFTFAGQTTLYYEVALGPFSSLQSVAGLIATIPILVMGVRYFKSGRRKEATTLILAMVIMYAAAFHDMLVGNDVYHFIYLMEYAYMATVLMMTSSLSNTVVDAAITREELRKSEEWLRSLVETTSDWVWEVDKNGRYTYASPKVRDLLGYEPEEVLGRSPFDFMPPDESQTMGGVFQSIIQNHGIFERVENNNLRKDGQPVVLETSGIPFFSEEGELLGYRGIDRDITERKKAENALKESEEKFRSIVENSLSGIFKLDNSYHFVYVNNELCRILGYPREILLGLDFRKVLSESSREFVADRYIRRQRGEDVPSRYELDVVRFDGVVRHAEMIVNVVTDASRTPSTMGQLVDITERKQAEEALRRNQEMLRTVLDQFPGVVFWKDIQSVYLGCNQAFAMASGLSSPMEIVGKTDFDLPWAKNEAMLYRSHDRAVIESGQPRHGMIEPQHQADGGIAWFDTVKVPLMDGAGNVIGILGASRDITEQKHIEDKLRVSEERLQQVVRVSNIGIFDHDHGTESVYWSPDVRKAFGIEMDEVFSLADFIKHLHPDDLERIGAEIQRAHDPAGDGLFDVEYRFVRRDGAVRWFAAKSQTFFASDGDAKRPVRTIGAVIDITERKRIEGEREKLIKELEAKNAELERFTYTVSHDLKSPLVTIKGFLGFLKRDFASQNEERFLGDIERISNATVRMDLLLRDLLELSRIGRLINPSENVSFDELAHEAVELVHGQLEACGVQVQIAPYLPAVYGDRRRLVEALQNLLDNAIKFMGEQPYPFIEIGQSGEDGDMPIFFVKDNGVGFAPEYCEHIFGLFNKLDPKTEGSGVGLALVKRIIEVHGGKIWVESERGKGATFYFSVPKGEKGS